MRPDKAQGHTLCDCERDRLWIRENEMFNIFILFASKHRIRQKMGNGVP